MNVCNEMMVEEFLFLLTGVLLSKQKFIPMLNHFMWGVQRQL